MVTPWQRGYRVIGSQGKLGLILVGIAPPSTVFSLQASRHLLPRHRHPRIRR